MVPAGDQVRRKLTTVSLHPVDDLLDELVQVGLDAKASRSARAWAEVARVALRMVAEGRIHPAMAEGWDAWALGPLTPHDRSVRAALAGWLPPEAHCLAVPELEAVADDVAVDRGGGDVVGDRGRDAAHRRGRDRVDAVGVGVAVARRRHRSRPFAARLVERGSHRGRPATRDAGERRRRVPCRPAGAVGGRAVEGRRGGGPVVGARPRGSGPKPRPTCWWRCDAGRASGRRSARALDEATPDDARARRRRGHGAVRPVGDGADDGRASRCWCRPRSHESLEARAHVEPPPGVGDTPSRFDLGTACQLTWRGAVDGEPLDEKELSMLAASRRPLVQLRGQWVVVDPKVVAKLGRRELIAGARRGDRGVGRVRGDRGRAGRGRRDRPGRRRSRRGCGARPSPTTCPSRHGLDAVLRPYQRRGVAWMAEMAELGLGAVLADDMGLGKTVQLIALHLHRIEVGADGRADARGVPGHARRQLAARARTVRAGADGPPLPRADCARSATSAPTTWSSPPMAWSAATRRGSASSRGAWWSPTRRSRSRTPTRRWRRRCARCRRRHGSRSPARPSRTG